MFAGFAALTCAGAIARAEPPQQDVVDPAKPAGPAKKAPPPRSPLPDVPPEPTLPWAQHVELGGHVAFVSRTAESQEGPAIIRYRPAIGFGLHGGFDIFRYLRFSAYFVDARHDVVLPPGALGLDPASSLDLASMYTFAFGARFLPTLPLSGRMRVWLTLGVGYGRMELERMTVTLPGTNPVNPAEPNEFIVRDRSAPFIEFPLGCGASFDIVKDRLRLNLEITGALISNQDGNATGPVQAIDPAGKTLAVGAFPELAGSFVQTLGISLVL